MSTGASVIATLAINVRSVSIDGLRPMMRDARPPCSASSRRKAWFSSISLRVSSARLADSIRRSGAKGFSMKSYAPSRMACTAIEMSPWPVTRITGTSGACCRRCASSSSPLMPIRRMSDTTIPAKSGVMRSRAASADASPKASRPASCRLCSVARRTSSSSSTKRIWRFLYIMRGLHWCCAVRGAASRGIRHRRREHCAPPAGRRSPARWTMKWRVRAPCPARPPWY